MADELGIALATGSRGTVPVLSPLDWSPKSSYAGPVDGYGLPIDSRSGEVFTIDACQFVLGEIDRYGGLFEEQASRFGKGLISLAIESGSALYFPCTVAAKAGAIPPGWLSAMAQGQAASVFLRLGMIDEAVAAVEPLRDDCFVDHLMGHPALLECLHPNSGIILNGHLIALLGVAEVVVADPDQRDLLDRFTPGLPALCEMFVESPWSFYEIQRGEEDHRRCYLASAFYQRLHASLFDVWGRILQSPHLEALARTAEATDVLAVRIKALRERIVSG